MIINRLKAKFKTLDKRIQKNKQIAQDQLALVQLLKLFKEPLYMPLTSWSICPRTVQHICNDIIINQRKNIIEFGSGFSTFCIAQLIKLNKLKVNFVSIENNEVWYNQVCDQIKELELSDFVTLIYAPITEVSNTISLPEQQKWYDVSSLDAKMKAIEDIDLIIVDGPFGGTTPYSRYSAIPYLQDKLSDSFSIFLDDTARHDEQVILDKWSSNLKCEVINNNRYSVISNSLEFNTTPINM